MKRDPDAAFERGRALFDTRRFFEAHEAWEELWLVESGARRTFLQGLIQVAAACHKAARSESPAGCRQLLDAGLAKLGEAASQAPPGIDLPRFIEAASRFRAAVDAWAEREDARPPSAFPRLGRPGAGG